MSQFVRVNCTVLEDVKPRVLRRAIRNIEGQHLDLDPSVKSISSSYGKESDVDCVVTKNGTPLTLGFKFLKENEKTKLNIRGDFWRTGYEQKSFQNMICQHYQVEAVSQQQQLSGGQLLTRTTEADGTIVMRYAV